MAFKKWNVAKEDKNLSAILAQECGISELAASILVSRGHTRHEDAMQFLTPDETLSSPFDLIDMDKAAERVRQAIENDEKITIYGDYDCDGVTSTAILYIYLLSIGAHVSYYIPQRDGEGYGLNKQAVKEISEEHTKLLITVDNGISSIDEIAFADYLGMDVIVTDHHQPGDILPNAVAVVNPHRKDCDCEFKEFAGVGVAFKFIAALEDGDSQIALEYFSDIVAVGTIGDVVPLIGENRVIVKHGLRALSMSNNMGLRALMEVAGVNSNAITAQKVAFSIVPRINAAGRMGSASMAVRLLLSEDETEAMKLAESLNNENEERKAREQDIISDVEEMISKDKEILMRRLLILKSDRWNPGIIGIVCSKLVERYGKPVLLMCEENGILRGSSRSIGEFHLFKALSSNASILEQYGGHKLAAGFLLSTENYDAFVEGMEEYARENFDLMPQAVYKVDKLLCSNEITVDKIASLSVLEPFGAKNEMPVFLLHNVLLKGVTALCDDRHQRLSFKMENTYFKAVYFGISSDEFLYQPGNVLDILVTADINTYKGNESVSLKVRDIRPAGFIQKRFFAAKGYYEKIKRNESVSKAILNRAVPKREEAAIVYRFLKYNNGYCNDIDCLYVQLLSYNINYCKLRIILDILEESGLISVSAALDEIKLLHISGKVDLTATSTCKKITNK